MRHGHLIDRFGVFTHPHPDLVRAKNFDELVERHCHLPDGKGGDRFSELGTEPIVDSGVEYPDGNRSAGNREPIG